MPTDSLPSMKMVLIDDDVMVLRNIEHVLTDFGFSVTAFESPLDGLDWIRKHGTDIVVSDIVMPKCDGFEVLRQVKEIDPQCDVILLTAYGEMEMAVRALRQGAADFFLKPFEALDLRAAIERTSRFRALTQQRNLLSVQVDGLSRELDYRKGRRNVMVGKSAAIREVARSIVELAGSSATVLITGESGTGKELVANAIHQAGPRKSKPMLTINCASIPDNLFESEMFGHMRGSFTGATETRGGYVAAAEGGILFLDEIGDLPQNLQGKILRLLEQKTYVPVGATTEKSADVRLISATNQSLERLVAEGKFRKDLFYRLNVCTIHIPPLRERREDIPLLAEHLGLLSVIEVGKPFEGFDESALQLLSAYDYPGNVRELRNIVENMVIHCRHEGKLLAGDLPGKLVGSGESPGTGNSWPLDTVRFEDVERQLCLEVLKRTDNNVSAAANQVGLTRSKFRRRLAALGLAVRP